MNYRILAPNLKPFFQIKRFNGIVMCSGIKCIYWYTSWLRDAAHHKSNQLSKTLLVHVSSGNSSLCASGFYWVLWFMQPFLEYQACLIFLAMWGKNLTVVAECELNSRISPNKNAIAKRSVITWPISKMAATNCVIAFIHSTIFLKILSLENEACIYGQQINLFQRFCNLSALIPLQFFHAHLAFFL